MTNNLSMPTGMSNCVNTKVDQLLPILVGTVERTSTAQLEQHINMLLYHEITISRNKHYMSFHRKSSMLHQA